MSLFGKNKGWDYLTSHSQTEKSYYDDDGSCGYINSASSSSYFEGDENEEDEDESYNEESEDDINATTVGNGIAALLGFAIGFGVPAYMACKNAKHEDERKEAEKRIEEERIWKEKQKINQKRCNKSGGIIDMEQIYHLCNNFRKTLENVRKDQLYGRLKIFQNFPNGCCTYTSDLLADYLYENGVIVKYIAHGETNQEHYSHCWVVIEGDIIVDITVDQFNGKVYFQNFWPIPKCYIVPSVHPLYTLFNCHIERSDTFGVETYYNWEIKRQLQTLYDVIVQLIEKELRGV